MKFVSNILAVPDHQIDHIQDQIQTADERRMQGNYSITTKIQPSGSFHFAQFNDKIAHVFPALYFHSQSYFEIILCALQISAW